MLDCLRVDNCGHMTACQAGHGSHVNVGVFVRLIESTCMYVFVILQFGIRVLNAAR